MAKLIQMGFRDSIYLRTLCQKCNVTVYQIIKDRAKYPSLAKYSRTTLYRHAKKPLDSDELDRRQQNPGRPKKVTARDKRVIARQIQVLRAEVGSFSSADLQTSCGLDRNMSNSTFRRALRGLGYKWMNTRRKGRLLPSDLKMRVAFCKKMERLALNTPRFWCGGIAMYVDGVGFEYKSNPYEHAKSLGAKEWRMSSEGLHMNCTAKGAKEGKTMCKFMVGMSFDKGVVMCVPLTEKMCGNYYARLIRDEFHVALERCEKPGKRILQDGDPSQNSKAARNELRRQHILLFAIPPRSPDLNPIENLFNQIRRSIKEQALQKRLERETKEQFILRVQELLFNFDKDRVNNLILSMPKRVNMVMKKEGIRIKY